MTSHGTNNAQEFGIKTGILYGASLIITDVTAVLGNTIQGVYLTRKLHNGWNIYPTDVIGLGKVVCIYIRSEPARTMVHDMLKGAGYSVRPYRGNVLLIPIP